MTPGWRAQRLRHTGPWEISPKNTYLGILRRRAASACSPLIITANYIYNLVKNAKMILNTWIATITNETELPQEVPGLARSAGLELACLDHPKLHA